MTTPKEISNKIKQDAKKIQHAIKAKTGLDISTKPLDKVADTLINDCKNERQGNYQSHVKLAVTHAHQAIDSIASELEKRCTQKQINNPAKQEIKQALTELKTKLQAIDTRGIEANDGIQAHRAQQAQTFGKESKQHNKHPSNTLNKNQLKGVFGSSGLKNPPNIGRKEPSSSQPHNK